MTPKRLAILSLCGAMIVQTSRADVFHMGPGLTSLQFVTVGNPGNAPDTRYNNFSVGSVDHVYQIGKYEITAGQYAEFLNAVAKADPNGLYEIPMGDPGGSLGANVMRNGSSPNYTYSVAADWANRPVNYVSFWDAARFANWIQNGQPTGAQGPGTTEAGAYVNIGNQATFARQAGARFYIPTEDEWYKAAYDNKNAGVAADYFDYPTGSNATPINSLPDTGNHVNFEGDDGNSTTGAPYYRTEVGAFGQSASPYGTFDQGGNVWEWNETAIGPERGLRGGSFYDESDFVRALSRSLNTPELSFRDVGFRIAAAVPEPSTKVLAVVACGSMLWLRRRYIA